MTKNKLILKWWKIVQNNRSQCPGMYFQQQNQSLLMLHLEGGRKEDQESSTNLD